MSEHYERGVGWRISALVLTGMYVGHMVGHLIGPSDDERVRDVQLDKDQIEAQLTNVPHISGTHNVILEDEEHTLTFNAVRADGTPVVCRASYEVGGQDGRRNAQLAGDLACTQTLPAPPR